MDRIHFTEYEGHRILIEDFTKLAPGDEFIKTVDSAQQMIASQPPKSVLAILDATGVKFDSEMLDKMLEFVKANTPYIKAATVVGIDGLLKIVLSTLSKLSGREFHIFSTREEAMRFLIQQ